MYEPRPIPWSQIHSWTCQACGECCMWFSVPLNMYEYAKLCQAWGFEVVEISQGRGWLRKRADRRCVFAIPRNGLWICGLQQEKPHACKMWPFRVSDYPTYGRKAIAKYETEGWAGYVYVDPRCPHLIFGKSTQHFKNEVVAEFVRISLHTIMRQRFSTASSSLLSTHLRQRHSSLEGVICRLQ